MVNNPQSDDSFWKGKRCLITGADGFLATHLANSLIRAGALVCGLVRDRQRVVSSLDLYELRPKMTIMTCDVRDYRSFLDIVSGESIDTVFHLAASSIVGVAARGPLPTLETNILGTINVLEVCRQQGVKRILVASSDKAYGDHPNTLPFREGHALKGLHIYDTSKSCVDLIAQTYYSQFQLPVRVPRCCNIYGPGDLNFSRLVPGTISRLMEGIQPVIRAGQAGVKRQYMFVQDAVDAYLAIGKSISESPAASDGEAREVAYAECAYNVGSSKACIRTTQEMLHLMQGMMGTDAAAVERPRPTHAEDQPNHQYVDSEKIKKELGWAAHTELESGLRETIAWYQTHRNSLKRTYQAEILSST